MENTTSLLEHKHFILKATVEKTVTTEAEAKKFLEEIVEKIGMQIAVGPITYDCKMIGNQGLTAMVIIETSHCVFHCWTESSPQQLQFDLYSCQDFNELVVTNLIDDYFTIIESQSITLGRNFDEPMIINQW